MMNTSEEIAELRAVNAATNAALDELSKRYAEQGLRLTIALTEKSEALRLLEMYATECKEAQRMLRELLEIQRDSPAGCPSEVKSITLSNPAIDACCTQTQLAGPDSQATAARVLGEDSGNDDAISHRQSR